MSWFSSIDDYITLEDFVGADDGERIFVDVATHGIEPFIRIILDSGAYYTPADARRIADALQAAASLIESRPS